MADETADGFRAKTFGDVRGRARLTAGAKRTKAPARFDRAALAKVGVSMLAQLRLVCDGCGKSWEPAINSAGRLVRNYWVCPRGCNDPNGD